MSSIQTGIELNDQFANALNIMIHSVNFSVPAIYDMQQGINAEIGTRSIESAGNEISQLSMQAPAVYEGKQEIVKVPIQWENNSPEVFTGDVVDGFQQELQTMDVFAVNDAYLRLSQTVDGAGRHISDNTDEQEQFNAEIGEGAKKADELVSMIKNAVMEYVNIQNLGKVLGISDELAQTTSRLDMMNSSFNKINGTAMETPELVNMVYAAAQDARMSFGDMADVVAGFGNNARDAFSSQEEVVAFADLVQKQMAAAGAGTQEAVAAGLQLSEALGSGVLRGGELNSIFGQMPDFIQSIADYLDVPVDQIFEMEAAGKLSADVIKAAIFASADEINEKFESMPMTWGQIWQSMQNTALIAFQPVLQRLSDIANSETFQAFMDGAIEAMAIFANVVRNLFDLAAAVGGGIADHWSMISPVIYGVVAALALYAAYQGIASTATAVMTAAQIAWNAVMYASPIAWIILLMIALVVYIFTVCQKIAEMTGIASSGFGIICGGVNVVIQFFKNLGLTVADITLGIANAVAALAVNIMTAFYNAICSVQAWWYGLLSTVLFVIADICEALNKLPFVEIDYSGISSAAVDYAAKSAEAEESRKDFTSVSNAFQEGFGTFDTFQDGWASDAFHAGASWGDGVADAVSNFSLSDVLGKADIPDENDYISGFSDAITNSTMGGDISSIAGDTGNMSDSLDASEEELKYMRDLAEQEAVNRYTLAEVSVDMSGMQNNINNGDDIDGFITKLTELVNEAVDHMTEGVHE